MSQQPPECFINRLASLSKHLGLASPITIPAKPERTSFRINTLKTSINDAFGVLNELDITAQPVPWLAEAFTVDAADRHSLVRCNLVNDGRVYIQGLSSILATLTLNPQPDENILDLAAAPGGKTLHIAATMQGRGSITAVEPIKDRFFTLQGNLDRAGAIGMVRSLCKDGVTLGRSSPNLFDRVLLDAPCSSEARIRNDQPETWQYWGEKKIKECARKQKALLRSAIDAVRPGGVILYCTCTFAPEENEAVINHALNKLGNTLDLLPIDLPIDNTTSGLASWNGKKFDPRTKDCRRVLPNEFMDGFFLALLRKRIV